KYIKDPVEIHNIKQRDGETLEDFMERFNIETGRMKGAPECMRISGFMHGINNPELTKRLNEHVPKTMEEMMIATTAFIRGEAAAASKKKGHGTPKEILAAEANKFQPPPPMVTPVEKRNSNKFCDFHNDKGHSTDECMQLKKQIEELVRAGKLSHLIKEMKQGREQPKTGRKEAAAKDKPTTIYMVRSWQRTVKQKITQSFKQGKEITFPPLTNSNGTEGPPVIEAEIGGHTIHRMYIDGGSSMEILYEHYFNRLRPKIKSQMVPATTSLTGFSGETTWPLGQLRLLLTIGDVTHSTKAWMNFMIVKSLSPYNEGIVTIRSSLLIPAECALIDTSSAIPREKKTRPANLTVPLHPNFPDQEDCYPLPKIDWKVESLCGYPFKCFLDAYKGYHQIQLAAADEEKMAFHTGQGVYCYTKMPFGLKNAGATYQRLMDKAFESQMGQNIEVYVDDLVVKSHTETEMTAEAKQAFQQLKQHLSNLPLLAAPKPQEELIMYLSVTHRAISAVLMTERGTAQTPVYFISRTLQGPELNYSPMEKLVLSLVFATKRLRRYFQAHPITVITDQPIKQIMSRPDVAGRLQKWSIMLGEHNITYRPRTSIKGQILADFINKIPGNASQGVSVGVTQEEPWTLFTDGSSCVDGSGAGLILTNPEGVEFTYALRFKTFSISQVLRSKNKKANALSKIASTSFAHLSKQAPFRPFPEGSGKVKFLIVAMANFTKWIEAKAVATITGGQSNELVERANRSSGEGIKARLGEGNKNWVEELPHVLWAHRTMIKSSHGDIPFSLTYGTEAVMPAEIGMPTYRTTAVDVMNNDEELRLNLDLLEERRELVAMSKAKSKSKMMKYYNSRVRGVAFKPGDFVYRSNDASHAVAGGKLGPKWEGPYEVTDALENGAYKLRSIDGTMLPRTWNVTNLKRCYL
nr:reverse transcriptase domain-containing protein [Tanacetum cinerariifolium]